MTTPRSQQQFLLHRQRGPEEKEADDGEEDTLVMEPRRAGLVHLQEMEWREEESTGARDEGETSGQLGPLENE